MTAMGNAGVSRGATEWKRLGRIPRDALVDARLQLHHAIQIIVSAPISYLEALADDSHTNLEWRPDSGMLVTRPVPSADQIRFAVRPVDLSLHAIVGETEYARLSLRGRPVADAVAWLAATLRQAGCDDARLTTRKHYEIPAHAVAGGAPFDAPAAGLAELARAYHDAWILTSGIAARDAAASPPRCWPHHFDLATLITLPAARDGVTRTIGVGLSPGDEWYAEPYLYVGPSPYPPTDSLPALARGHWHTTGWVGAVHLVAELAALQDGAEQAQEAGRFLTEAMNACRTLLDAS